MCLQEKGKVAEKGLRRTSRGERRKEDEPPAKKKKGKDEEGESEVVGVRFLIW